MLSTMAVVWSELPPSLTTIRASLQRPSAWRAGNDALDMGLFVQAGNHDQNVRACRGLGLIDRRRAQQSRIAYSTGRPLFEKLSNYLAFL